MPRKRRECDGSFKAKVTLEAIRGLKAVSVLATAFKVHPTQITMRKKQLLAGAADVSMVCQNDNDNLTAVESQRQVSSACSTAEPATFAAKTHAGQMIAFRKCTEHWS